MDDPQGLLLGSDCHASSLVFLLGGLLLMLLVLKIADDSQNTPHSNSMEKTVKRYTELLLFSGEA